MTHREEILELQSVRDEHAARLSGSKPEESAGPSAWHATTSSRPSSAGVRPGSARSRPSSAGVRPGSARSVRSDFGRPCSVRSRPGSARSVRSEELAVARTSQLLETEESRASRADEEVLQAVADLDQLDLDYDWQNEVAEFAEDVKVKDEVKTLAPEEVSSMLLTKMKAFLPSTRFLFPFFPRSPPIPCLFPPPPPRPAPLPTLT